MTDKNFVACDVKDVNRTVKSFMLKIGDGKIDDIMLVQFSERATPDMCLDYRLENGALKDEFVGKRVQDFVGYLKDEFDLNNGRMRLDQNPVEESLFRHNKILENLLTTRGEKSGLRILEGYNKTLTHETTHQQNTIMLAHALAARRAK